MPKQKKSNVREKRVYRMKRKIVRSEAHKRAISEAKKQYWAERKQQPALIRATKKKSGTLSLMLLVIAIFLGALIYFNHVEIQNHFNINQVESPTQNEVQE